MKSGEYIVDRWLVSAIRRICEANDITFHAYSDNWLLELEKDHTVKRILGYKFGLNNSIAAECAEDKVITHTILNGSGIASVPHLLVRTKATINNKWKHLDWEDIVVKPLTGTSGHAVKRFENYADAEKWMNTTGIEAWAISPYLAIKRETRLIILDNEVLLSYEKLPVRIDNLKMFNLGLGATARDVEADSKIKDMATRATKALQLRLAAVDIIELESGEQMVLEVNDGIMMEHYARTSAEYEVHAYDVYEKIVSAMMQ